MTDYGNESLFEEEKKLRAIWLRCRRCSSTQVYSRNQAKFDDLGRHGLGPQQVYSLPPLYTQYGRQVMMPGMSASLQQGGLTICHLPRFRPAGTRLCGFLHGPAQPAFEKLRSPGKGGALAFAHAIRAGEGQRRRHDRRDREARSRTEGARGGKDEVFDDEAARYQGRRGPPRRKDQKRKGRKGCQQRFVWRWRKRQRWPRREGQ